MMKSELDQKVAQVVRVYDILNCGPANRFVANGKLVHNSGGDGVNLQNLPRGGTLRQAMSAPYGHVMIACDSSQIEARMIGWLAGETDLTLAFLNGEDIYSKFASVVYGREIVKGVDKTERHVGKTAILGLGYGMGKARFKDSLKAGYPSVDIDIDEAERIVNTYRQTYPLIVDLWKQADAALRAMSAGTEFYIGVGIQLKCDHEGVHLPNGMKLIYPELRKTADGYEYMVRKGSKTFPKKIYGAMLVENICQALARIVVFTQMAKIDQKLRKYDKRTGLRFKTVLTVHDEVVAVVPDRAGEKVKDMMVQIMSTAPKWAAGLPIACEAEVGVNYGECK